MYQIRNSYKSVGSKHQKEFLKDLKLVYKAVNRERAESKLDDLELKWGSNIPLSGSFLNKSRSESMPKKSEVKSIAINSISGSLGLYI